jgi:mannosyltransferase
MHYAFAPHTQQLHESVICPVTDQPHPFREFYLPIVMVLLIAAGLRFAGTASRPVWTDEGWSTWAMSDPAPAAIIDKVSTDRHPPLFFLAVGLWSLVAGESRIALRLPSILMGVLTVALVYRIGDDTFGRAAKPGREDVAWYGMLIFALLPVAVYYAQEIRHFGWFVATVCASSLVFVRLLRRPTRKRLVLYAISVALMMYTLYFGVWVGLLQVIVGLVMWRGDARRNWRVTWPDRAKLVGAWAGALVLYIPWLVIVLLFQWDILTAGIRAAPGTFNSTLPQLADLLGLLMGGGFALTVGLYVVGFWGALVSDRTDVTLGLRFANPIWLAELYVVLWGAGLFVLLALINLSPTEVLSARTTVFLAPAFALVIGAGVVRLRTGVRWSLLGGYIAASVLLPPLIQPRLAYDAAAEAVAQGYSPGDLIVLETVWDDNAFRYELRRALGNDAHIRRTLPWVNNRDPYQPPVPQLQNDIDAARRVWVVQWNSFPEVLPYLRDNPDWEAVIERQTFVGEQYAGRFRDVGGADEVQVVLFTRAQVSDKPAVFGERFALADALFAESVRGGAALHVDLWWQAVETIDLDYSVGVYLIDQAGRVVVQDDAPPSGVPPTSAWAVDDTVYHDRHSLALPRRLPPGEYTLAVSVYFHQTPGAPLLADGEGRVDLGPVTISR